MKKFLVRATLFLIPVILLHIFTFLFYRTDKGDLIDVGYIMSLFPHYTDIFKEEYKQDIHFTKIDVHKDQSDFNIFTMGDSFSEQDNYGYKNYLGAYPGMRVLHFDDRWHWGVSSFQELGKLINGDFFDNKKIKYVILESVERNLVSLAQIVDPNQKQTTEELGKIIEEKKEVKIPEEHFIFPSDRIVKFPLYNILYFFDDNAYLSETYRVKLKNKMFSAGFGDLLFLKDEITLTNANNDKAGMVATSNLFNYFSDKLAQKGIKLIVLICPDKYDIYYDYMVNNKDYPRPTVLNYMDTVNKKYLYVHAKDLLSDAVKTQKDLYLYGDTHWSPWAAKLVAANLYKIITTDSKQ